MAKALILFICATFLLAIAESQRIVIPGLPASNGTIEYLPSSIQHLSKSSGAPPIERGYAISSAKYSAMRPARDSRVVKLREEDQKTFRREMLKLINRRRIRHGSQPLVLNRNKSNRAQNAAENMAYAQNQDRPFIRYSTCKNISTCPGENMGYAQNQSRPFIRYSTCNDTSSCPGENMGYAQSLYQNAAQVLNLAVFLKKGKEIVNKWYEEKEYYNFDGRISPYNSEKYRDFTQMLWNDTTSVAFGAAVTKVNHSDVLFLAAQFYPRGNIMGFYRINVYPETNGTSTQNETTSNENARRLMNILPQSIIDSMNNDRNRPTSFQGQRMP